ncbi:MAG: hypothetical protein HQL70_09635 [Magnetococcales bacterium]|nr:hypothetical protein [Magnetococcales bacterium]
MAKAANIVTDLHVNTAKWQAGLGRADRLLKSSGAKWNRTFNAVEKRSAKLKGAILSLAAGFGAMQAAGALFSVNAEFQKLSASLKTVTGSTENAKRAMETIKDFAKQTPYDLAQVTQAFIKLKAMGLDANTESMRSYGNTASAMGKSIMQMIEAVADAATGEFERLKEFGIKARSEGNKVSFTFRGVTTTIGKNAREIEGYLRKIGQVEFAGAMSEQMKTLSGEASNLGDSFDRLLRTIGEAGANSIMSGGMSLLTELLSGMSDNLEDVTLLWKDLDKVSASTLERLKGRLQFGITMAHQQGDDTNLKIREKMLAEVEEVLQKNRSSGLGVTPKRREDSSGEDSKKVAEAVEKIRKAFRDTNLEVDMYGQNLSEAEKKAYRMADALGLMRKNGLIEPQAVGPINNLISEYEKLAAAEKKAAAEAENLKDKGKSAMQEYADSATDSVSQIDNVTVRAFSSMEDALTDFVMTGKMDFASLANSIIADMVRMQIRMSITGKLMGALQGAGGISGVFSSMFGMAHTGGVIGSSSLAQKTVPISAFANAPRFHAGGLVGGEVPIIAKKGEGVFTPEQMAALGPAGGSGGVVVNVINNSSSEVSTQSRQTGGGGIELDVMVDQMVSQKLSQPGSKTNSALRSKFNMKPVLESR